MSKLAETHAAEGLVVLAVNTWDEEKDVLAEFVKDEKLRQTILLNGREVAKTSYGVKGVPTVFWIDRAGIVVDMEDDFKGPGPLEQRTTRLLARAD